MKLPPDPEEMNNRRSELAANALTSFWDATHYNKADQIEPEENVSDFLADLAHYCDRNDLNLADLFQRAEFHYNAETNGEGAQFSELV